MTDIELLQSFRRNSDGTWSSVKGITISNGGGQISVGPGMTFTRGVSFMGIELASVLDGLAASYPWAVG